MLARFSSRVGVVAGLRFIDANVPPGSMSKKACDLAEMAARAGCVWSVAVKDPPRLLPTRQPSPCANLIKGVPKPNGEAIRRADDRGTELHPDPLSTSTNTARSAVLRSAFASSRQEVRTAT